MEHHRKINFQKIFELGNWKKFTQWSSRITWRGENKTSWWEWGYEISNTSSFWNPWKIGESTFETCSSLPSLPSGRLAKLPKPNSLKKFSESKKTPLEKIEDIELLRALEIGQNIKTFSLKGDSFSVDVLDDYKRAEKQMNLDKFFRLYKI